MTCDTCHQPLDSTEWDTCEVCSKAEAERVYYAELDALRHQRTERDMDTVADGEPF